VRFIQNDRFARIDVGAIEELEDDLEQGAGGTRADETAG
jgi:hypothetical protein